MKPFKLTIAITGGIAGYKVVDLLDKLKLQKNIKVKLILTQNAIKLFGTKIFTEVCKEFYTDVFEEGIPYQTLIASVLHKYVTGRLSEQPSSIKSRSSSAAKRGSS